MWFLQVFNSLTYLSMKVRVIVFVSQFRSVHSVVSDSLWRHGLQHTRLPCPSPTPRAYSDWVGYAIQPSHPLMSPSPPALKLSQHHGLFQWVSSSHQVAKVLEFQLQQSLHEHPGLISFRMDWLDLLAVQGTLKSLLQHHSSKASIHGTQLSSQSNSHIHTWLLEKP